MSSRPSRTSSFRGRRRSARAQLGIAVTTLVCLAVGALASCGADETRPHATPATSGIATPRASAVVYRTPTCGCCKSYEDYLRKHGYTVASEVRDDLAPIRAEHKVPDDAASCHTVIIDGYAVEGHVPLEAIDKLLAERPAVDGIGIPGMPTNAPGMGEPDGQPIEVVSFDDGTVQTFTTL